MQQIERGAVLAPVVAPQTPEEETRLALSFVIPVLNEVESVALLYQRLCDELERLGQSWEIIFVDDGSVDGTFEALRALRERDPRIHIIRFRRNFGKTPALVAG